MTYRNLLDKLILESRRVLAFPSDNPIQLKIWSGEKPSSYFIPDIIFKFSERPKSLHWFVEIWDDKGNCIVREGYTNQEQKNLAQYEEKLCERVLLNIFTYGISKLKDVNHNPNPAPSIGENPTNPTKSNNAEKDLQGGKNTYTAQSAGNNGPIHRKDEERIWTDHDMYMAALNGRGNFDGESVWFEEGKFNAWLAKYKLENHTNQSQPTAGGVKEEGDSEYHYEAFNQYWLEKLKFWRDDDEDYRNIFSSEEIAMHAFGAGTKLKSSTAGGVKEEVKESYHPEPDEKEEMRSLQLALLGLVYDGKFPKKEGIYYFIEDDRTHLWLTRKHEWTNNPNECMKFENEAFASVYAFHLSPKCYIVTEHEFPQPSPSNPQQERKNPKLDFNTIEGLAEECYTKAYNVTQFPAEWIEGFCFGYEKAHEHIQSSK